MAFVRTTAATLTTLARRVFWSIMTAVMPSPQRDWIIAREGTAAAEASLAFGMVQGAVGLGLYMFGYLAFIGGYGAQHQWLLLEHWTSDLDTGDLKFAGIFGFFAWHMLPHAWVFMYLALVGLVRCITYLAVREPMAEPIVALGVWAVSSGRRKRADTKRARQLGEERPDRLIESPEGEACDLMVVSCRDKPAWNDRVTIEVEGRFYRLASVEDRWDGDRRVVCHLLSEIEDDHEAFRGFVSYESDPLNPRTAPPASGH